MTFPTTGYLRATEGAETTLRVFVRDDAGPVDMTEQALSVTFRQNSPILATLPATGAADGGVSFTLDAGTINRTMPPGLYTYRVMADGRVVHGGYIEVL